MTDYEYADLFASFLTAQNALFANYMTMVFAMLTASWFLAKKLTPLMAAVLLFIYSIWSLTIAVSLCSALGDFVRLGGVINEAAKRPESGLQWIGPASDGAAGYMQLIPAQTAILCIFVYVVSIAFFFIVRRRKEA
ncbi:MAG: hypothetical protein R3C60_15080 [Parvularculaceae bacterium]